MPLPNLNPLDKAPPPGSQRQVATSANIAQLHQRITDLERRLSEDERTGTKAAPWQTLALSFGTGWSTHPIATYGPRYRYLPGGNVQLAGLIYASGGGVIANMATLPSSLIPQFPTTTEQYFPAAGFNASTHTASLVYLYGVGSATPGRISGGAMQSAAAGAWLSLAGLIFPVA